MVELEKIKRRLRIETDEEDLSLQEMEQSASATVLRFLNRSEEDIFENLTLAEQESIHSAIILLVGSMYRDREATSTVMFHRNPILSAMLRPFKRILSVC